LMRLILVLRLCSHKTVRIVHRVASVVHVVVIVITVATIAVRTVARVVASELKAKRAPLPQLRLHRCSQLRLCRHPRQA
jgi:hypothetical protein